MTTSELNNPQRSSFAIVLQGELRRGIYSPGETLPSERDLCAKYHYSRPTIHKGLQELEQDGFLLRQGRAVSVSPQVFQLLSAKSPLGKVIFLMDRHSYANVIYVPIFETLVARLGESFSLELMVTEGEEESVLKQIGSEDLVVFFGHFLSDDLQKQICRKCYNSFSINHITKCSNWIAPDNYNAGRLMAEELYAHGHRDIAVVMRDPDELEFHERLRGVQDFLKEHGLAARTTWVPSECTLRNTAELYFKRFVLTNEATAVIGLRHSLTMDFYDLARKYNMEIPEDFSIIGFDDTYGCDFLNPALTTIRYPGIALAERLADELAQAYQHPRGKIYLRVGIPPLLIRRESVR